MTKANFTVYNTRQGTVLQSYQTMMSMITCDGRTILNEQRYSVTTSKHVSQFLTRYGGSRVAAEVVPARLMQLIGHAAVLGLDIQNAYDEYKKGN